MATGRTPSSAHRTWWWVFAVLIAMPAVALSVLGVRSIRAADIERHQHLRDQQADVARLVNEALREALARTTYDVDRADAERQDDTVAFVIEDSGVVAFPAHRLYFGPFGARPASLHTSPIPRFISRLIDAAQTAEARGRQDEARVAYAGVRAHSPLEPWASLRLAILDADAGERSRWAVVSDVRLASSPAETPAGIPLAIVAATYVAHAPAGERARFLPLVHATLTELGDGRWWMSADQRRAYGVELQRLAVKAGAETVAVGEDTALSRLRDVAVLIRGVRQDQSGSRAEAAIVRSADGHVLVVREPAAGQSSGRGTVLFGPAMQRLFEAALGSIATRPFGTVVRTTTGDTLWGAGAIGVPSSTLEIEAVRGAELAFTIPALPASTRLLHVGLVVLPIVMLAGGLVMTARIVRRELALARLQSTFVAAVTHEFKSPITSTRLLVERLASGRVAPGEAAGRYYAAIGTETDRLEDLVNRLLESQKLQSGRRDYVFRTTSLPALVSAVAERLRPQAEARNIRIDVAIDADLPHQSIDRDSMSDAVANLIDNALKYSPDGTTVHVLVRATADEIRIEVTDEGIGVNPPEADRIFEPFYRSRRGDHASVHGTGLGLSLVKAAAEAHGGSVAVSSDGRRGSTFVLRLPSRRAESGAPVHDTGTGPVDVPTSR